MVLKRGFGDLGNENPGDFAHNNRFKLKKDIVQLLREHSASLEASIRKVVRQEVDQAFRSFLQGQSSSQHQAETSRSRNFKLQFDCQFPARVFTGNRVAAQGPEGPIPIKVVLLDTRCGAVVTDGPLSSIKIEIVALPGDFEGDERGEWTESEFNRKLLCAREGKRPLLVGERVQTMSGGVAFITAISFTDNSSWVKSKRFKLAVRIRGSTPTESGVQEAVSAAIKVKDRRGEVYQKHGTPSLLDEVWRLTKIAKDGILCRRLAQNGILRVKDFLQLYHIDPVSLQNLLGVSNRIWETIVAHATSCPLNDEHYEYFGAEEGLGLMLNCVLQVVGVTYGDQSYQSPQTLNVYQKWQVEKLRRWLHQNQDKLVPAHNSTVSAPLSPDTVIRSAISGSTAQHGDFQAPEHDQPEMQLEFDYSQPPYLLPFGDQFGQPHIAAVPCGQDPMQVLAPLTRDGWDASIRSPNDHFLGDELFEFKTSAWYPANSRSEDANSLVMASASGSHIGLFSSVPSFDVNNMSGGRKSKAGWSKVRAAVRFKILFKQSAAANRKKRYPFHFYAKA